MLIFTQPRRNGAAVPRFEHFALNDRPTTRARIH